MDATLIVIDSDAEHSHSATQAPARGQARRCMNAVRPEFIIGPAGGGTRWRAMIPGVAGDW